MADDSNEQPGQASSGGAQELSQADIDTLLSGASGAAGEGDAGAAPDSTGEQGNISAPGGADPSAADVPETPSEADASATGAVTQEDVDALVIAAGSDEDAVGSGAAEGVPPAEGRDDSAGRPSDETAAIPQASIDRERSAAVADSQSEAAPGSDPSSPDTQPYQFQRVDGTEPINVDPKRITMLNDVNLRVRLQLGQTRMLLEDVLNLGEGSVVELDKLAGDPVDIVVNDRLVARGEVLVLNDVFCVRVCEVLSNDPHRITV